MKVKVKLTEEMLGGGNPNKELHEEFIASKSKDAEKTKEELESLPAEELMAKETTVFSRDTDGCPIWWDYQIKGYFKEQIGIMCELPGFGELRVGKSKLTKFTHRRVVDNYLHVFPRRIRISLPVSGICVRPQRNQTMQGERVCIASSEVIAEGAQFEFEVMTEFPALEGLVRQALDRGKLKGFGQWRNSGKGRFTWEEIKE